MAPLNQGEVDKAMSSKPSDAPRQVRVATATWRLAVLVVVVAGLALVLVNTLRVYFVQASQIAAVKEEIAAEKERIAELEDRLARWEDPEYVRSVARVRLGWVMPGETGYRVIGADGQPLDGTQLGTPEPEEPEGPWWDKMWKSVGIADRPAQEETPTPSSAPSPDERIVGSPSPKPSETP